MSVAQCEVYQYLQTLDGYPLDSVARTPASAPLNLPSKATTGAWSPEGTYHSKLNMIGLTLTYRYDHASSSSESSSPAIYADAQQIKTSVPEQTF